MRILLFGTGDYYQKYKKWFAPEEIDVLIDNDKCKQGSQMDGHEVVSPEAAAEREFDCIVILSVHEASMREQLVGLGIPEEKIYKFSELHRHPEILNCEDEIVCYGEDDFFAKMTAGMLSDTIVLMSHNLDLNGAALALFYGAQVLKAQGYSVLFVSWTDGPLRKYIRRCDIPVVIDAAMQIKTQSERKWLCGFRMVICNTINYYQFLSKRDENVKVLWWLHDPVIFYESLDLDQLRRISEKNITVCAVGPVAERAFKTYFPSWKVRQLLYGIPDINYQPGSRWNMEIVTIGNVQDYKGQDILVEALKRLPQEALEKVHVRIIGSQQSAYATAVREAAKGVEQIAFLQAVDRAEIHKVLEGANLLVCPSRADCMPVVVCEAMQHGLPCIVSDATGTAAYINDGVDGFVVKAGDAVHLSDRLFWCITHPKELASMGKKTRLVYERHFSMKVFEGNWLCMIRDIFKEIENDKKG